MILRYRFNMEVSSPSLSDLNNIEQEMDEWQIKRGNPYLKNSTGYSQSLMYSYNNPYFGIELIGAYTYADNPIYETILLENNRIVNTIENQKKLATHSGTIYVQHSSIWRIHFIANPSPFLPLHYARKSLYTHLQQLGCICYTSGQLQSLVPECTNGNTP